MQNYPNLGKLILGSASPRRRELLAALGVEFEVRIPDIDETPGADEPPRAFAERLAAEKAAAVPATPGETVIAADTIVVLNGQILGKPRDSGHAFEMLSALSGCTHEVITGVCIRTKEKSNVFSVTTQVVFRILEKQEIVDYIASGCPMDKAGAYAIQGGALHMVKAISGSYTNVVGLPLCEIHEVLISL
ncbi:Maf family protein [Pontiella agarivorans]|uniref:dTTP/UTP pyrophosphatase n=1 Tax=Pontiella agarivorans TaxID=3038953 RepID=A0ABU5MVB8_9BACT|nr:Maf family protein [Pontiella agarivorans]MDZ8118176.1 Maf family protein [Pontiella agarivorans]